MKTLVLTLMLSLIFSASVFAEDPHGSADMQKMMEKWQKIATPGTEHGEFAKCSGEWTYTSKMWMDPSQPPEESTGSRTVSMLLGGRFMKFDDSGMTMGTQFHGTGIIGYDNYNKVYQMFWIDDMGTGMYTAEGKASADGKTITMMGTMDDCMLEKKDVPVKYVWKMLSDTRQHFEIWNNAGTPEEKKTLEMDYAKK